MGTGNSSGRVTRRRRTGGTSGASAGAMLELWTLGAGAKSGVGGREVQVSARSANRVSQAISGSQRIARRRVLLAPTLRCPLRKGTNRVNVSERSRSL